MVEAAQRDQDFGHGERAVGTLVVLEEEYERSSDGAGGAVEGVHRARTAVGAEARAEPPR